jgi:streptogramin lyase/predicted Ser/Thr protein kinase
MSSLNPGDVIAGHRIEEVAGRGGMGIVYRARQLGLDRIVAFKVIAPELSADASFRERFKRESRIAASIEHPHVIPVHEAGEEDGLLYISMRFIDGTDLRELVRRDGRLSAERAVRIVGQVCAALDAAHARGLVHRDIKPANVLIAGKDGEEHAYLTDFGLTKHRESQSGVTKTGMWVGTVDYMAPEQIEGRPLDARSDVYAVGCMMFHALTGDVPFARDTDVAKLYAHVSEAPPMPSEREPGLPRRLDPAVTRAMAKDPDERFPSAGDFGRALAAGLAGEEPAAPERTVAVGDAAPSTHGRFRRGTRPTEVAPTAAGLPAQAGPQRGGRPRRLPVAVGAAALLALAVAALAIGGVFSGGDDDGAGGGDGTALRGNNVTVTPVAIPAPAGLGLDGDEAVWVSSYERDTVSRVDAASGRVTKRVRVGDGPTELTAGEGSLWVSQQDAGTLGRVDLESEQVVGVPTELPMPDGDSIAVGEGAVWTTVPDAGVVARVDPSTARVAARIRVPDGVGRDIAVGEGGVWVVNSTRSSIVRIDPETNRPGKPIPVGGPADDGFRGELAVGEGSVWVAALDTEVLVQVDPDSQRVTRRLGFKEKGALEGDAAIGAGFVWVTDEASRLLRVDPRSGRTFGSPLASGTVGVRDIEVGGDAVWVTGDPEAGTISRITT